MTGVTSVADLVLRRQKFLQQGQTPNLPNPQVAKEVDPLVKSQEQKSRIWERAQKNQNYYLLKQEADREHKPWFRYVKEQEQYSEFVMLTPAMAQVLLDHLWAQDDGNRKGNESLIESYKRDIEQDRWVPTDEAIGINCDFQVYNGQHRLHAIVRANRPMPMYITWNVLNEARWVVDSGAKRNLKERLSMVVSPKLGRRTVGFCKAVMRGIGPRERYTDSEIAEFAFIHDNLIDWIHKHLPTGRAEVQAAVAKAYLWYGPEKVEPFCQRLREITFSEEGDPAKALYKAMQNAKQNRLNQQLIAYKKTLTALYYLEENMPLNKIYERDRDIFEWEPGWKVPEKKG